MDMHQAENWSVFKETIRTNNDTEGKFDLFSSFFFLSFIFVFFGLVCLVPVLKISLNNHELITIRE